MKLPRSQRRRFKRYLQRGIQPGDLQSLILDEDVPSILQEDHVASRQHDSEFIAPVSVRAHQRLERNRTAAGIRRKYEKNVVKKTVQRLKSSAVFHELQAEANWRWAEDLEGSFNKK